jgi:hypothetical protein
MVAGRVSFLLGCFVFFPTFALAQATLTGVVRDSSGAVLPGVTVETSSPVLIGRVRTAVTDGTGQYRIVELPPGPYEITFTASGFIVVKREGVEVTGSGAVPINIEMRVGSAEEIVTVTGATPVVDTQSARRESVLNTEIINNLPATRSYGAILAAVPGLQVGAGNMTTQTTPSMTFFTANGGRANEGRMMIDSLSVAASLNGGGVSTFTYDVANAQEMQVSVSGNLGDAENGGPQVNLIPKSGGNRFKGSAFYSGAGRWSTGDNLNDTLRSYGLSQPAGVIASWDASGAFGGPLKRDRLWYFANIRDYGNQVPIVGAFGNLNAGDPTKWTYVKDPNLEVRAADSRAIYSLRLTSQVTERDRVSFSHEYQRRCSGSSLTPGADACRVRGSNWVAVGTIASSPETFPGYHDFPYDLTQATWSSPVTSRLLLEAGFSRFQYLWSEFGIAPPDGLVSLIPVTEQSTIYGQANFTYRGLYDPATFAFADNDANPNNWRASASYVTGAHNVKVGYQGAYLRSQLGRVANQTQMRYTFNNGVPASFGYYIAPRWEQNDRTLSNSLYAQDQWTVGRLTLQGGLRYDRASSWAPAEHNGTTTTSRFNAQPISFPRTVSVSGYNDLTPRMGIAGDVFGNGKTAVKVNVGKYLQSATTDENYTARNPANLFVTSVGVRNWTDGNSNFVVDCDLSNPLAQNNLATGGDSCAALGGNNLNFGNPNPTLTVVNPAILEGWGVRPWDWQFGVSVQQEIAPRVSVNVGYNRRWFGNFFVVSNSLTTAADYDKWTFTAPQNPALPVSGSTLTYFNINPTASARGARNYQTFETDYAPARTQYWHGVDINLNARLRNGVVVQGGTTTGRGVQNTCALVAKLPELLAVVAGATTVHQRVDSCDVTEPFLTTFHGLAAYTIPTVDVLVSASMRSVPTAVLGTGSVSASNGTSRVANINVPNTVVQQTLGRLPANGLPTGTTSVNMLVPGVLYGGRVTQVDMRFAKILRFGKARTDIGVDLYNAFNTSDANIFVQTYDYATNGATYMRPSAIVSPRFVRINVRFDF